MGELRDRILCRVKREGGCLIWQGATNDLGYAQIWIDGRVEYVHRVMFMLDRGPIPEGHEIDHLCRTPGCVEPTHLEAVTHRENVLRGDTVAAKNAAKTHCPKGHPYEGDNLYVAPRGDRQCRTCRAES